MHADGSENRASPRKQVPSPTPRNSIKRDSLPGRARPRDVRSRASLDFAACSNMQLCVPDNLPQRQAVRVTANQAPSGQGPVHLHFQEPLLLYCP